MSLNTYYGREGCKDAVWKKGKKIKGKNPAEYRLCRKSNTVIRYSHYGNNSSIYNWDIDHIIPKSKNGSNHISNLQPVSSSKNRSMGNSLKDKEGAIKKMFTAMRSKRGIIQNQKRNFKWNDSIIGKQFWVKPSPVTSPSIATINSYTKKDVTVHWEYGKYESTLPLDADLFEPVSQERILRCGVHF